MAAELSGIFSPSSHSQTITGDHGWQRQWHHEVKGAMHPREPELMSAQGTATRRRKWSDGARTQTAALIKLGCSDFPTAALIPLSDDHPSTSCSSLLVCALSPPPSTHTHARTRPLLFLLSLINTHINHPKYLCDKPIINLHCRVQYSDNEFSGRCGLHPFINCWWRL